VESSRRRRSARLVRTWNVCQSACCIAFNPLADQSDLDEQAGLMHMFEGMVLALRNPRAHDIVPDEPEIAQEYIALMSLLAKRLDAATRR
jgi:Protein of unknown function (Hypoth_ymh)